MSSSPLGIRTVNNGGVTVNVTPFKKADEHDAHINQ